MTAEYWQDFLRLRALDLIAPVSACDNGYIVWGRIGTSKFFRYDLGTFYPTLNFYSLVDTLMSTANIERKPALSESMKEKIEKRYA